MISQKKATASNLNKSLNQNCCILSLVQCDYDLLLRVASGRCLSFQIIHEKKTKKKSMCFLFKSIVFHSSAVKQCGTMKAIDKSLPTTQYGSVVSHAILTHCFKHYYSICKEIIILLCVSVHIIQFQTCFIFVRNRIHSREICFILIVWYAVCI